MSQCLQPNVPVTGDMAWLPASTLHGGRDKEWTIMALTEVYWDQYIPLPKLAPLQAKATVALLALLCFINSYDGEFVFDDSEAIINNKVRLPSYFTLNNHLSLAEVSLFYASLQDLRPTTPLNNIWMNDFWGSNLRSNSSHKSYRPFTVLTFR